jgi:2',3'-cyclic-nucleotide 2'-phosphodiesterase
VKLVFIGDIVGKPGRRAVQEWAPKLRERYDGLDAIVANAENAAGGRGLTAKIAKEITSYGVDFMTTGNHVWDQKEFLTEIGSVPNVIRPYNVPPGTPGTGSAAFDTPTGKKLGVVNLAGSLFMNYSNPFPVAIPAVEAIGQQARIVIVDMHAEATSEKVAMGWHLDGIASLVVGTHTHVQTADETILPNGAAYITDLGMTGPHDSVIGVGKEMVVRKFLTQLPAKFEVATGDTLLCGVYVEIDERTRRATLIERLRLPCEDA